MKRTWCGIICIAFACAFGACSTLPELVTASIWRPERARKLISEKGYSFAEFQIYADQFPYWEPLDSLDLSRINSQGKLYKRWDPDWEALQERGPTYLDRCRHADTILGWWFDFLLDTIVVHSPIEGDREKVVDMECYCMQMMPTFLVRGETKSGKAVDLYLGSKNDSILHMFYDGSYYVRIFHRKSDEDGFSNEPQTEVPYCFYSWRPDLVPPPLPNWYPRVIARYEEMFKGQINPDPVPAPRKPRYRGGR